MITLLTGTYKSPAIFQYSLHYPCSIRDNFRKTCLCENAIEPDASVIFDAVVLPRTKGINLIEKPVRVPACQMNHKSYRAAKQRILPCRRRQNGHLQTVLEYRIIFRVAETAS